MENSINWMINRLTNIEFNNYDYERNEIYVISSHVHGAVHF